MDFNMEHQINSLLSEFIALEREIKEKTKRLKELKDWCKAKGTFNTTLYACVIKSQTRTGLAGLEIAVQALGREILEEHDLIRVSQFDIVHISSKTVDLSENFQIL